MDPFRELTPEEAEAAYDAAEPVPLTEADIMRIVRYVMVIGKGPHARPSGRAPGS